MSNAFKGFRDNWEEGDTGYRRRVLILALLLLLLFGVGGGWGYYLFGREPISALLPNAPVIAEVLKPHYLFSIYDVEQPVSVAVSPDGERIYAVESGGERTVKVFDRDGDYLSELQSTVANPLERAPLYISIADNGNIFLSERRKHTVYVYDEEGNYQTVLFPPSGETVWAPFGLAFSGDNIYITDATSGQHRVLVYDWNGRVQNMFGEEGQDPGQFWYPNAIELDEDGLIYVSDSNNGRIQVFDPDGNLLYTLGGLNLPRGMTIDSLGRLNVVDAVGQLVRVYDVEKQPAEVLYELGDLGMGDGEFNFPNDIASDGGGRLYIADRENNRIQVWSY